MLNLTNHNQNKDKPNHFQINHSNHNQHLINNKLKMILQILAIFQNLKPRQLMTMFLEILDLDLMMHSNNNNNNKLNLNNKHQINFHKTLSQIHLGIFHNPLNHINQINHSNSRHNHFSNNHLNNR